MKTTLLKPKLLTFFSRLCAAACLLVVAASPSFALDDINSVTSLLKRMAEANRQISYQGIFSYEHGGALKTVKVFHAVRDGQEFERIIHLSGPKREVVRRGNDLSCQRLGDAMLRGAALGIANISRGHLENYYDLYIKGDERVAGRDVTIVHVVPKDDFRYGYVLGIDKETGLLLQSMLIGTNKRVLERFQFVDISIGTLIDDMALEPTDTEHHMASLNASLCLDDTGHSSASTVRQWKASWLPPGFAVAGSHRSTETGRETQVFTDGLAVFSIFIDSGEAANLPIIQAQRGATVAFLIRMDIESTNYAICVVGEIPIKTAKKVAESMARLQ
ncbi:MAG: MucB/RseB C-terminal domain-containing protein [Porticoccus sp.]|nr:MucB/RseB C-terminal domain-containing protein [Porticoccus sp.]